MTDAKLLQDYARRILTAHVYDVAIETRLDIAPQLSRRLGNRVLLKPEDMQPVFSFKLRGVNRATRHQATRLRSANTWSARRS